MINFINHQNITINRLKRVSLVHIRFTVMRNYKAKGIKTTRIGVVLPEEVRLQLERVADSKSWSISQTAAFIINEWLENNKGDVAS